MTPPPPKGRPRGGSITDNSQDAPCTAVPRRGPEAGDSCKNYDLQREVPGTVPFPVFNFCHTITETKKYVFQIVNMGKFIRFGFPAVDS